jgi:DNA-directed RNA polymerase subunit RPC12/RpoP
MGVAEEGAKWKLKDEGGLQSPRVEGFPMILLKSCPRCSGDIIPRSDQYGEELVCLQCGYWKHITFNRERLLKRIAEEQKEERVEELLCLS